MSSVGREGLHGITGEGRDVDCSVIPRALYTGSDQLAQDIISPEDGPGCSARH